jgi:hypothetical protein
MASALRWHYGETVKVFPVDMPGELSNLSLRGYYFVPQQPQQLFDTEQQP